MEALRLEVAQLKTDVRANRLCAWRARVQCARHTRACEHTNTHTHENTRRHARVNTKTHTHTHTHTHAHTHTHVYSLTHTPWLVPVRAVSLQKEQLQLTVSGLEKERDFYFGKLRQLEVCCASLPLLVVFPFFPCSLSTLTTP